MKVKLTIGMILKMPDGFFDGEKGPDIKAGVELGTIRILAKTFTMAEGIVVSAELPKPNEQPKT